MLPDPFIVFSVKHTKTKATFFKAVRKSEDGIYYSDHDHSFKYVVGETKTVSDIDTNIEEDCGTGIHIAHLQWALDFGKDWDDLAILEVETKIDNIVFPINTNGKVRTSSVKVLREIPLEECGIYGKILARRMANHKKSGDA